MKGFNDRTKLPRGSAEFPRNSIHEYSQPREKTHNTGKTHNITVLLNNHEHISLKEGLHIYRKG